MAIPMSVSYTHLVQITAEKQGAGENSWKQIMAKDKNGNDTEDPYLVWKAGNERSGSNYGFTVRISEFNQSSKGGDSPFNAGDRLQFTYTFYYETVSYTHLDVYKRQVGSTVFKTSSN